MQKEEIVKVGRRLYERFLTVGTSGNISVKTLDGIYITSSGSALGNLKYSDIILVDFDGVAITKGKPSSEKFLHTQIYKQRSDVKVIIHTHPVYLTTFAACHQKLDAPIMSENILYFEDIPVAEYAMPSSKELVENTVKYINNRDVVLMANHGVVVLADTLENAFLKLETAEYYAHVTLNTKIWGNPHNLTDKDVEELLNLKKKNKHK